MRIGFFPLITLLVAFGSQSTYCQDIQVSRANKTISVTVTESVWADAEIAEVSVGHHNYGGTKESAFEENLRAANKILRALLDAGLPKNSVETKALRLERVSPQSDWPAHLQKERQFEARQTWAIRVPVAEAQKVVDAAVGAGANHVEDVEWLVADPQALEARAGAVAVVKARTLAEKIAKELGGKVGELVYASNRMPKTKGLGFTASLQSMVASVRRPGVGREEKPVVLLFPQKVEREATVHAVFALE